jgi:hypothetical protein
MLPSAPQPLVSEFWAVDGQSGNNPQKSKWQSHGRRTVVVNRLHSSNLRTRASTPAMSVIAIFRQLPLRAVKPVQD